MTHNFDVVGSDGSETGGGGDDVSFVHDDGATSLWRRGRESDDRFPRRNLSLSRHKLKMGEKGGGKGGEEVLGWG